MGRKCFVPYCKSGYNTCQDVVAMFSCPNDSESLKLWSEAIARQDRPLSSSDCVCEKHFREEDIIRSWKAYDKDGVEVMRVNYKRVRLRDGSVPCIFPQSKNVYSRKRRKYNCENYEKINSVSEESATYPSYKMLNIVQKDSNVLDGKLNDKNYGMSVKEINPNQIGSKKDSESEDEGYNRKINARARLFDSIWQDASIISLPSKSWAVFLLQPNGDKKLVFTQMGFSNGAPVPIKQVCLDYRMRVELFLKNSKLNFEEMGIKPPKMYDIDDVSSFIKSVDGLMDWE